MFVSHPIDGATYVARHRQRGGKILIWTRVPVAPGPDARTQFRFGRSKLLSMEFADFEKVIRDELARAGIVLEDRPGGKTDWRRA